MKSMANVVADGSEKETARIWGRAVHWTMEKKQKNKHLAHVIQLILALQNSRAAAATTTTLN